MLNVVCVKWGTLYGPEYVNRLYAMVARNLRAGTEGRFICYTDDPSGLDNAILSRPLPGGIEGWWNKLYLFEPHQFESGERVLFLDLDTLIVGPLDGIAAWGGDFAILRDFYRPDGLQSSVMAWRAGFDRGAIWARWQEAGCPRVDGGDQTWIERAVDASSPTIWQDEFPGRFVSYKEHCIPYPPDGSCVVVFHGDPKPHDCGRKWVDDIWSENDMAGFSLALERNTLLSQIRDQSKASADRGLPRLTSKRASEWEIAIVGGGPSLNEQIPALIRHSHRGGIVWALNGAYRFLRGCGVAVDAVVLLDARKSNVEFVDGIEGETAYLASQVHPAVYDALSGKSVIRFDLDALGDCGTTVGTHAMCIAFVEGYRRIHLFGFDSSYRDDDGHAYPQSMNAGERVIDVAVDEGRAFRAAPWMVQQAKDFLSLAPDLIRCGCEITVHGDGLLPYVAARMAATAETISADVRAAEILKRIDGKEMPVGAEIGVFAGELSARLLGARPDLRLLMVDSWEGDGAAYAEKAGDWHETLSQQDQDAFARSAASIVEFAGNRAQIIRARSSHAAPHAPDLDFAFIDADHSYEGCRADIEAWWPKICLGGFIGGHDYANHDFPEFGVTRAVDEFASAMGCSLELGENFTWFIERK